MHIPQTTRLGHVNGRYSRFDDNMGINSHENDRNTNDKGKKHDILTSLIDEEAKYAKMIAQLVRNLEEFLSLLMSTVTVWL